VNYLLDTCVLSEPAQPRPDAMVKRWFAAIPESRLCISVLSIGELRKNISRLTDNARARAIAAWLDGDLMSRFEGRILDIDIAVCNRWGSICGALVKLGRSKRVVDSLLAATAIEHELALVTRNVADFSDFDLRIVNPWQ
jgi:predicted nucleic acid-binding protein